MFIKVVFKAGHVGKRKYHEMVRYLVVDSLTDALTLAKTMPRVKKGHSALISSNVITLEQYISGKQLESTDPYLTQTGIHGSTKSFMGRC